MKEYQQRVIEEKKALDAKIIKLRSFVNSAEFKAVEPVEQFRLHRQLCAMNSYSGVLSERIEHFND